MKIVFMGTPQFSVPILEELVEKYNVSAIITQPDKKVGRKKELVFSPVKKVAIKNNIKCYQPDRIKEDYQFLIDLKPDLIITAAYGQIIPKKILELPKYGCINVHGSLLPKLRGGAPIHRAITRGHKETGITIMYMSEKMDAGDIISKSKIPILNNDNLETMHNKLSLLGKDLLIETIPLIINGKSKRKKQDEKEVTYAFNIKREDELLNFTNSANDVYNHIRGFNPWPVAYTIIQDKQLKIYDSKILYDSKFKGKPGEIVDINKNNFTIMTGDLPLTILEVKQEGKKKMNVKDYLNGEGKKKLKIGLIVGV